MRTLFSFNMPGQLSSVARGFNFVMRLYLHQYFMYGETVCTCNSTKNLMSWPFSLRMNRIEKEYICAIFVPAHGLVV